MKLPFDKSRPEWMGLVAVLIVVVVFGVWMHRREKAPTTPAKRIAIVLDDWGYSKALLPEVLALDRPLTLAVLPHLFYSSQVPSGVQNSKCEIILHLPMEAQSSNVAREPAILSTKMSKSEVRGLVTRALATVPRARGVSNHQGSKATKDLALMRLLFETLKEEKLFFLDSLVTNESVCESVAKDLGVPFAVRSVFLDNVETEEEIAEQLLELVELVEENGVAIGVGHDKRMTLKVLREWIPKIEEQGIVFVPLSEVVERL